MKILIAGCGYVGTELGARWAALGAEVWGLRRDAAGLANIAALKMRPLAADLLDLRSLKNLPQADVAVLCQGLSRDSDRYETTYKSGTANFVEALKRIPPKKLILISSTSVYSTHDGSWVDEMTDPVAPGYESAESQENAGCLLSAEKTVLSSAIPSVVFRLAGIYGPARNRIEALRRGRLKPSLTEAYTNRIHRDDIVSAVMLLAQKGNPGEIYIGADDAPCTQKEFYSWICGRLGMELPQSSDSGKNGKHASNKRCSNAKIKALGLKLKYPDFKKGYEELIMRTVSA